MGVGRLVKQERFVSIPAKILGGSIPPYPILRRPCHEMRCAKFTKSPHVQPPEPNHPSSITLAGPLPNTSGRKKTYHVDSIQDWSFRLGYPSLSTVEKDFHMQIHLYKTFFWSNWFLD